MCLFIFSSLLMENSLPKSHSLALRGCLAKSFQNSPSIFVGGREVLRIGMREKFDTVGLPAPCIRPGVGMGNDQIPEGLGRLCVLRAAGRTKRECAKATWKLCGVWCVFSTYLVSSNTELISGSKSHVIGIFFITRHINQERISLIATGAQSNWCRASLGQVCFPLGSLCSFYFTICTLCSSHFNSSNNLRGRSCSRLTDE